MAQGYGFNWGTVCVAALRDLHCPQLGRYLGSVLLVSAWRTRRRSRIGRGTARELDLSSAGFENFQGELGNYRSVLVSARWYRVRGLLASMSLGVFLSSVISLPFV